MLILVRDLTDRTFWINYHMVCCISESRISETSRINDCYLVTLCTGEKFFLSDTEGDHLIGVMHIR